MDLADRQLRLGVLLALIVVGIAALLRLWEPSEEPSDTAATAEVWNVEADAVTRVEVDRKEGGRLVLVKDGDAWRVEEPFVGAADDWRARDLVNDLTDVDLAIPIPDADVATFGLGDPPVARVKLTLVDGASRELAIGIASKVGYRTYVALPGGGVGAVDGDLSSSVGADAGAFRDRHVVRFQVGNVTAVVVQSPMGTLDLYEDENGWWLRGKARASAHRVEELLLALLDLKYQDMTDASTLTPPLAPAITVRLALADGTLRKVEFEGAPREPGVLASTEGGGAGFLDPEALAFLGQGPTDVLDDRAFPLDDATATKIAVDLDGTRWEIAKDGLEWKREGSDAPTVNGALDAVRNARIEHQPTPPPGVTDPWGTVTLTTDKGDRVVEIGQREGTRHRVAKDRAGGEPYLVPVGDIEDIKSAFSGE